MYRTSFYWYLFGTPVCVCVSWPPDGPYSGPRVLFYGPFQFSLGRSDLTAVCPPFESANPFAVPLTCIRQPFPNPPAGPLYLGGTYAGLEVLRLILDRPGVTTTMEFPCGNSRYPSGACLRTRAAALTKQLLPGQVPDPYFVRTDDTRQYVRGK